MSTSRQIPFISAEASHLVAVYGTLRQGQNNHDWMTGTHYIGLARSQQAYALYTAEWPYVVETETVSPIVVELYQLTWQQLLKLDELEDHPHLYERKQVAVVDEQGNVQIAWLYFSNQCHGRLCPSGDWLNPP